MSPRYSQVRSDKVEYSFWLTFDETGNVALTRGEPKLARTERSVSCTAVLPRSLWRTPSLRASITVAEGQPAAFQIDVEAVQAAVKQALGVDVDFQIVGPEPGK